MSDFLFQLLLLVYLFICFSWHVCEVADSYKFPASRGLSRFSLSRRERPLLAGKAIKSICHVKYRYWLVLVDSCQVLSQHESEILNDLDQLSFLSARCFDQRFASQISK